VYSDHTRGAADPTVAISSLNIGSMGCLHNTLLSYHVMLIHRGVNELGDLCVNGGLPPKGVRQHIVGLVREGARLRDILRQLGVSHGCVSKLHCR